MQLYTVGTCQRTKYKSFWMNNLIIYKYFLNKSRTIVTLYLYLLLIITSSPSMFCSHVIILEDAFILFIYFFFLCVQRSVVYVYSSTVDFSLCSLRILRWIHDIHDPALVKFLQPESFRNCFLRNDRFHDLPRGENKNKIPTNDLRRLCASRNKCVYNVHACNVCLLFRYEDVCVKMYVRYCWKKKMEKLNCP